MVDSLLTQVDPFANLKGLTNGMIARNIPLSHPFVPLRSTELDQILASVTFGWMLGFMAVTTITAINQSGRRSTYTILCWLALVVDATMGSLAWLYLTGCITHSFSFFFFNAFFSALKMNLFIQIPVNRLCLLLHTNSQRVRLIAGTAIYVTVITLGLFYLGIPSQLQVIKSFSKVTLWYNRAMKILHLLLDTALNYAFIWFVKDRLVVHGLKKYEPLIRFTKKIIVWSILVELVVIALISYPNRYVYIVMQAALSMTKLQVEMVLSNLIVKVAKIMNDPPPNAVEENPENREAAGITASQVLKDASPSDKSKTRSSSESGVGTKSHKGMDATFVDLTFAEEIEMTRLDAQSNTRKDPSP